MKSIYQKAAELEAAAISFVIVTQTAERGHAPQNVGAKILVTRHGLEAGTVGGGKVEAKAIILAQEILQSPDSPALTSLTWNLQRDVGMSCGGEVSFLFERSSFEGREIIVFGAGHIAQALIPLLLTLNRPLIAIDSRQAWLNKLPDSNRLRKICTSPMEKFLDQMTLTERQQVLVMTMGHSTDLPILERILRSSSPKYIGVIGSPVKAQKIRRELMDMKIAPSSIEKLRCPMGLIAGTNEPAEIAISIAAELLQLQTKKTSE